MNNIGTEKIKTERLLLRRFEKDDVLDVYNNYGSDSKVSKYISWVPCDTIEKCKNFIDFNIKEYEKNPRHYSWTITYEGTVIGSIGIFNVEDNDSGELGYSLGSKWWGNGFMTECVYAVLDYAFNKVGFHRIYATFHEENTASKNVLTKSGMTYEGKMRDGQKNLDGSYSNLDLYAILSQDFKKEENL